MKKWLLVSSLGLLLSGCASIGPHQIYLDRNSYNDALRSTRDQQLLSNIVGLTYLDSPTFLQVTSITASYSFSPSVGFNPSLTQAVGGGVPVTNTTDWAGTSGITYSDQPTISYVPVESSDFINEMLTPVQLSSISLLFSGGVHNPDLIMRLTIESINDVDNAWSASDEGVESIPHYKTFYRLTALLDKLVLEGATEPRTVTVAGQQTMEIHIREPFINSPDALAVKKILHMPADTQDIILLQSSKPIPNMTNIAYVQTRSLLGMMIYLSHSVQVPQSDIDAGDVPVYVGADGQPFDWSPLMNGLMTVYSSNTEPTDAFVKVYAHNHWFYIKESDTDSKLTMSFLNELLTLTAGQGNTGSGGPVITIPARS